MKKFINRTDSFNNHRLEMSLKCIFVFKNIISDFELLRNIGGRDDLQKTYIKMWVVYSWNFHNPDLSQKKNYLIKTCLNINHDLWEPHIFSTTVGFKIFRCLKKYLGLVLRAKYWFKIKWIEPIRASLSANTIHMTQIEKFWNPW